MSCIIPAPQPRQFAYAEFIEASAWYEGKRLGLAIFLGGWKRVGQR